MHVTVDVVGDEAHDVEIPPEGTYADLLAPLDLSVHQVSLLVDGQTVPEDRPVDPDVETVRVVKLITGG